MIRRLLLACALALASPASATKPLFSSNATLSVTLQAPFERLLANRDADEAVTGTLTDPSGNRLAVAVQLRGVTRRSEDVCAFPPLHVRFTAPPPATSVFSGEKKLKLVTHCKNGPEYDRVVLLEYAAYRMYQALTPRSFGARLMAISYVDGNGVPMATRPAFFIEDLDDVAKRTGTSELRTGSRIAIGDLNAADATRYALFQHMLANHDWSMRAGPAGDNCCHNAKLIGSIGAGKATPIPYDFDFSGFVDAPYAQPPEQLKLTSVRQRKFRGYCAHKAELPEAARLFRAKHPAMEAELAAVPGLDARARGEAMAFMRQFFAEIATDQAVDANIAERCVG